MTVRGGQDFAHERKVFGGLIKENGEKKAASTLALRFEEVLNVEPGKVQLYHTLKLGPQGNNAKVARAVNNRHIFPSLVAWLLQTGTSNGRRLAAALDMQRQTEVGWKSRLRP